MNIRFMSAQRRKQTRSAASRYRRYVRLTSTTGELRLQLIKCQSKKEKERHAKREIRAVGRSASTHTASPSLPALTVGFRGSVQCLCPGGDGRLQKAPSTAPPCTSQARCPYSQPPLAVSINVPCEKRCITGKIGGLIAENTSNAHRMPQSI